MAKIAILEIAALHQQPECRGCGRPDGDAFAFDRLEDAAFSGAEQREGMQAFLEKRTPEFGSPN